MKFKNLIKCYLEVYFGF